MKDLPAIKGRYYIHRLIEEGEHEQQDFKFAISDARKIARSISAFSNRRGGRLLIGVKDNGIVAGIRNEEDIYMIETAAETFCRPAVKVELTAFKVDPGLVVLRAEIPRALRPPVCVLEEGGVEKAYYRVKDENIVAPKVLMRAWEMYAEGSLIQIDESHRRLLAHLERVGKTTLEAFTREVHLSSATVLEMVARLVAASVVEVSHDGTGFVIHLPEAESKPAEQ